jgi:hypothetical protein
MLRTTVAVIALLLAGAAQAAPVAVVADDTSSFLIKVVDDATNENDAIEMEENKLPSPEASDPSAADGAVPSGGDDNEATQLEQEKND